MGRAYDELDINILRELKEDASISYKKLAEKLKTHPNTLMQRIKRLENDGVLKKYTVNINYKKLGLEFRAMILLRTKGITVSPVKELNNIIKMPQIVSFYGLAGQYDAVVMVEVRNMKELNDIIQKIQSTPGIVRTSTYLILTTYKHHSEYNPFKID